MTVADELLRQLELTERLLEVDDVDPVALRENEAAHLGIPTAGLVSEVDARLEELLETRLHCVVEPLVGFVDRSRHRHRRLAKPAPDGDSESVDD